MPRIVSRSLVWAFVAFIVVCVCGRGQEANAAIGYRLIWEANENDDGRLLQLDDHRLYLNLSQSLSDRMTAAEDVNYNYRWEQEGTTRETVSPRASLGVSGDIFNAGLSVSSLRNLNSEAVQADTDRLGMTWASSWKKKFVPELLANYDYSTQKGEVAGNTVVDERQGIGGQVNWDLLLARVYYSFKRDDNKFYSYSTTQDSQLARINADRTWLNNRLHVSLGHNYSDSRGQRSVSFNTSTTADLLLRLADVRTSLDSVFDSNPADTTESNLSPAPAMINGDLVSPAYSVSYAVAPVGNNSIFLATDGQSVDRLYLYAQDTSGNAFGSFPLGVSFTVYSNPNNVPGVTPWTDLTATNVVMAPVYDSVKKRFVFAIPSLRVGALKVVVNLSIGAPNIDFTEVQVEQVVHGVVGSTASMMTKTMNNRSDFGFDYKFNHAAAFSYSLLIEKDSVDGVTTNERENHNGSLRMQNSAENLKSYLSVILAKNRYMANPEVQTITYQIDVNKVFLPTLTTSVGGSHEVSSAAGVVVYDRNRYSLYTDARLYPDLHSRLDVIYWEQENHNSSGPNGLTDSLRGQLGFDSRVNPSLNVTLSDVFEKQTQDQKLTRQQNAIALSGNWQLSEWLTMTGSFLFRDSKVEHDAYIYTAGVAASLGVEWELKVDYSLQDAENMSQSGLATLRWSSKRNISWELGCNYAESDGETNISNVYKVYSRLQVNFVTR